MKCPECSADTRLCQCAEAERDRPRGFKSRRDVYALAREIEARVSVAADRAALAAVSYGELATELDDIAATVRQLRRELTDHRIVPLGGFNRE